MRIFVVAFAICVAAQLYLVFFKSFNWDEFLHFSQVYQAKAGTLSQQFQVLHARILWWAPQTSGDLVTQMRAARIFNWLLHLATLWLIFAIASRFVEKTSAALAAFAYFTAGYVFTQSFSIRADPMVTAALMTALYLMIRSPLSWTTAVAAGALIGLAGMMTVKAIFFAPCFAGFAWLQRRGPASPTLYLTKLAMLAGTAVVSFAAIYVAHRANLAPALPVPGGASQLSHLSRWVSQGVPFANYIFQQAIYIPLFLFAIVVAPLAWRRLRLDRDRQIALAGMLAPLLVLLFYRNTFPYFFTFLLAPIAVAIAPSFELARQRFGIGLMAVVLSTIPLTLTITEPRSVFDRQRALIDYIHREYPRPTGYLDYSGMIADYPRIVKHLISGIGIASYHARGDALIARAIDQGNVPFIIANNDVLINLMAGERIPKTLLPEDYAAIDGNYVEQWSGLWREGRRFAAGDGPIAFNLRRGGTFVLDGPSITLDGRTVIAGSVVSLDPGSHVVDGGRKGEAVLWRGQRLPSPLPDVAAGPLFTRY